MKTLILFIYFPKYLSKSDGLEFGGKLIEKRLVYALIIDFFLLQTFLIFPDLAFCPDIVVKDVL